MKSDNPSEISSQNEVSREIKTPKNKWRKPIIFVGLLLLIVALFWNTFSRITGRIAGELVRDEIERYSKGKYTFIFDEIEIKWFNSEIDFIQFAYKKTDSIPLGIKTFHSPRPWLKLKCLL